MERSEYLNEFYTKVLFVYGVNVKRMSHAIKFASESIRTKLDVEMAVHLFGEKYCLIKVKRL